MELFRQILTLTKKNLRLEVSRHAFSTVLRALLLPAAFIFFLGEAQNFFIAPCTYGIGVATQILPLLDALSFHGTPPKVVLVNSGHAGGDIDRVIKTLSDSVKSAGKEVTLLSDESRLHSICPNSIRQISDCYAAAVFHSSPSEGSGGIWNYTILIDAGRGYGLHVDSPTNDVELYPIPFQHAIDAAISSLSPAANQSQLPQKILQYPFTEETETARKEGVRSRYEGTIRTALAVAYFLGQIGVIYHLVGMMAFERERGISQLLEAMMPNKKRWQPQLARLVSYHLAFTLIYLPGWIVMAFITRYTIFLHANIFILLAFYLLSGMSLVSSAIFGAAFFRRTQLSAVSVTGISLILGLLGMLYASSGNLIVGLLSLFFPPIATVNFIEELAYWEGQGRSIDVYLGGPSRPARYPGLVYWYCLALQILLFPLLAAYIEKALFSSRSSHRLVTRPEKMSANPIRMTGLSKSYGFPWYRCLTDFIMRRHRPIVQAVNEVTANIGRGQITILLGPNGSGKTTTLRCIAGLERASGGLLEIENTDSLGICPQENVFWDLLTVEEHLKILTAIKRNGSLDSQHEIERLIQACDLDTKAHALAKSLSGGQKRKLQLAMMFAAGSKLCCVDEVSSGLDPRSRRKIWEILLAERGQRTFLLTTHFLDEADSLADSILILSKGSLAATGSAVELKQRHGGGYGFHLPSTTELRHRDTHGLSTTMSTIVTQGTVAVQNSSDVARVVDELDKNGVAEYGITSPSIENVLFNVLEAPLHVESVDRGSGLGSRSGHPGDLGRSIRILLGKRLIVFKRNFMAHAMAVVIAPIAAGIASIFLNNYNGLSCGADFVAQISPTDSPSNLPVLNFLIGPSSQISSEVLDRISAFVDGRASVNTGSFLHQVENLDAFNKYVADNFTNVNPGGIFLGQGTSHPTFAYLADGPVYNSIFTQNLLDSLLTNVSITAQYRDLPSSFAPSIGDSFQFILYFGLALTTYGSFFALYPTRERHQNIRALYYSNGLRALPLWSAYTIFDFSFVLFVSVVTTVVLSVVFAHWYSLGYLFVVLALYGLTSLLFSYFVSLFAKSQLAAFAVAAGSQAIMYLVYIIAFLSISTNSPRASLDSSIRLAHYLLSLFLPVGSLARAILVSLNVLSVSCHGTALISYPGDINAYGGPILYLVVQSGLLFGLLVWWDFGSRVKILAKKDRPYPEDQEFEDIDILAEAHRSMNSDDPLRVIHASKRFSGKSVLDNVTFGVAQSEVFALLGPNGAGKTTLMALIRGELPMSDKRGEVFVQGIPLSKHLTSLRAHLGFCPQFDAIDAMTVDEHLRLYAKIKGVDDIDTNVQQILTSMGLAQFAQRMASQLSGGYKRRLSLGMAVIGNPDVLLLDEPSSGLDVIGKRDMWQTIKAVSAGRSIVFTTHSMEEADALAQRAGILDQRMLALGTIDQLRKRYGNSFTVHLVSRTAPYTSEHEMERLRKWVVHHFDQAVLEERSLHGQLKFSIPTSASITRAEPPHSIVASGPTESKSLGPHSSVSETPEDTILPLMSVGPVEHVGHKNAVGAIFAALEANRDLLELEYYSVSPSALEEVFLNVVGNHAPVEQAVGRTWWPVFGLGSAATDCIV